MMNFKSGAELLNAAKEINGEIKAGKIEFKVDKAGNVHAAIAKASFDAEKIAENAREFLQTVLKLKPSAACKQP